MSTPWRTNYVRYRNVFLSTVTRYQKRKDVKAYLELLLSLLTIAVFAVFALKPTLTTIGELTQSISSKEQTLKTLEIKSQNLQKAHNIYVENEDNINLLKTAIASKPSVDVVTRQIEGVINSASVNVASYTISGPLVLGDTSSNIAKPVVPEDAQTAEMVPFTVVVVSEYTDFVKFVELIENLRRVLIINSYSIDVEKDEGVQFLVLNIKGVSPYIRTNGK